MLAVHWPLIDTTTKVWTGPSGEIRPTSRSGVAVVVGVGDSVGVLSGSTVLVGVGEGPGMVVFVGVGEGPGVPVFVGVGEGPGVSVLVGVGEGTGRVRASSAYYPARVGTASVALAM